MFENLSEEEYELPASEELIHVNHALEESKKIQSSLSATLNLIEKLKSKYDASSQNYIYNFTPSKRLSHSCMKTEYLMFTIYDTHLSNLCRKLDLYSPQRHQQNFSPRLQKVRSINYTSSSCSSSSPSSSESTELINQIDEDSIFNSDVAFAFDEEYDAKCGDKSKMSTSGRKIGIRKLKDIIYSYNRVKTDRIKTKREIEGALMSLDKTLTLSTNRATEAKNYVWLKEKMRTPIKRNFYPLTSRRSISTSMCRVKHSTPIQYMKRPLSTSVIF